MIENADFVPLPPDKPVNQAPANAATGLADEQRRAEVVRRPVGAQIRRPLGTDPNNLQPVLLDTELGPSESTTQYQSFTATNLVPGTTYYWRVVSRTMANLSKNGDVWSFTTAGTAPPPSSTGPDRPRRHRPLRARRTNHRNEVVDCVRLRRRRCEAALEHERRRREDHDGRDGPASYVDFTFTAVARDGISPVDPRARGREHLHERLRVRAVLELGHVRRRTDAAVRHDLGGRVQPGGLQRLRPLRVGLAG